MENYHYVVGNPVPTLPTVKAVFAYPTEIELRSYHPSLAPKQDPTNHIGISSSYSVRRLRLASAYFDKLLADIPEAYPMPPPHGVYSLSYYTLHPIALRTILDWLEGNTEPIIGEPTPIAIPLYVNPSI